ncbi:sodium- and chloride-dependent glycine transporter 2-like isoform X2 [Symsagittifera roscoffensis]|uniref:sodium- and chloride-dependent glycine transporter 2-like isoform X2 n=1 Tax=Symsagittifera roscoffensis TaxID=84072 RepID=UPI00307BD317
MADSQNDNGLMPQCSDEGVEVAEEALDTISHSKERGVWGTKAEFILSCVGFAVGLGNVVRFPYVCYESGGGAFLIPFCVFLVIAGIPMFFLELAVGQFSSSGPITVWRCAPLVSGLGYCVCCICFLLTFYYSVIVAWCMYYLFNSFSSPLPWSQCNDDPRCIGVPCGSNATDNSSVDCKEAQMSPAALFYFKNLLGITTSIEEVGEFQYHIAICLFLTWLLIFLALIKGIHSLGKVAYVTSVLPYILLTALLVFSITLPGSGNGIIYYIKPDFAKLADPVVWKSAASQIFFSFGIGWGCLIAFSSYGKFDNNCLRDAVLVSILDCATSIFAGFVIFAIIGFMAHEQGTTVGRAIENSPGLAFVTYPTIVNEIKFPQVWAVLFFVMLIVLGADTLFALVEGVVTAICDRFPHKLRTRKMYVTLAYCLSSLFCGIFLCFGNGLYVYTLFDSFVASINLLIIGILELIIISWVYGADRFIDDISFMLQYDVNRFWKYVWQFVSPLSLLIVLVLSLINYSQATVQTLYGTYTYPLYCECIGWAMVILPFFFIPCVAISKVSAIEEGTLREKVEKLLKPDLSWGPRNIDDWVRDRERRPELYEKNDKYTDCIETSA